MLPSGMELRSSRSEMTKIDLKILRPDNPWGNIAEDVRKGLTSGPKYLHCKYFYDQRGSELFDAICELPEYYLTRAEASLLEDVSGEIARLTQAREIIELGSGTASKTTILLDALLSEDRAVKYVPLDISESSLREALKRLTGRYQNLEIEALVCDYTKDLHYLSPASPCLTLFLGSTIGNFNRKEDLVLLRSLHKQLRLGDWFLLGTDLLKSKDILEAAYNDSQGITALFNKNILNVINRELRGDFDTDDFSHRAFLNEDLERMEIHLAAKRPLEVHIHSLDLTVFFDKEETIFTEISRKFTESSIRNMLRDSGFHLEKMYISKDNYFALALARVMD